MNVFGPPPADEAGEGVRSAGLGPILRRAALLVALAASSAIATHVVLSSIPSGGEVHASLAIDRKGAGENSVDVAVLEAQAKLIASRDTLRRAAAELGVTEASAFSKPSLQARVLMALGLGGGKLVSPEERLTDALAMRFSAVPSGRGRAIDVRFSSENADFAVRFVDHVLADYLLLQGAEGGIGARMVSSAAPVASEATLSPQAGGAVAGFLVLLLGAGIASIGRWRRRDVAELPEEAPLSVDVPNPHDAMIADREAAGTVDGAESAPVISPATSTIVPAVDLAGRRRVAVACFGEGDENRRLVDELAREGGFNGARIVVIDASRRACDRPGLAELLAGDADFADVIQRNGSSRAHEIGAGRRPLAALADDAEAAAMLIEALEQTYDLVLIDLGRLRADAAFALFARLAGQLMLTGDAEPNAVETLLAALGRRGVKDIVRVASPADDLAA